MIAILPIFSTKHFSLRWYTYYYYTFHAEWYNHDVFSILDFLNNLSVHVNNLKEGINDEGNRPTRPTNQS